MRQAIPVVIIVLMILDPGTFAAEPLVVELQPAAAPAQTIVTIGDVALVRGGSAVERQLINNLDTTELTEKDGNQTLTRRRIEIRLKLAGIDDAVVKGSDRCLIAVKSRQITTEEVVAVAEAELRRRLPYAADQLTVTLVRQLFVKLPEIREGAKPEISATPHSEAKLGQNQIDVCISPPSGRKLVFPVFLEARVASDDVVPASATFPQAPSANPMKSASFPSMPRSQSTFPDLPGVAPTPGMPLTAQLPVQAPTQPIALGKEVVVLARQKITLVARSGGLEMTLPGEAMQEGRIGQTIRVMNSDKKPLQGRVVAPGVVEMEVGGTR